MRHCAHKFELDELAPMSTEISRLESPARFRGDANRVLRGVLVGGAEERRMPAERSPAVFRKWTSIMQYVIYALACISIVLALGSLQYYKDTKHIGVLLASTISIVSAVLAIWLVHWWPLLVGFGAHWGLRLLGLDPHYRR
jgi:hypothetical protein